MPGSRVVLPVERWSRRSRARVDAAAEAGAGPPAERCARELAATLFLASISLGFAALLAAAAAVSGAPRWAPVAVSGSAVSFALARRRAGRRGGPDPR